MPQGGPHSFWVILKPFSLILYNHQFTSPYRIPWVAYSIWSSAYLCSVFLYHVTNVQKSWLTCRSDAEVQMLAKSMLEITWDYLRLPEITWDYLRLPEIWELKSRCFLGRSNLPNGDVKEDPEIPDSLISSSQGVESVTLRFLVTTNM